MSSSLIAQRDFTVADQEWFASVSGDCNPMHMDALFARRTMAGFPVVHGIHTLVWTLDALAETVPDLPRLAAIKANFEKMIYVGDQVRAVLVSRTQNTMRLEVMVGEATATGIDLEFGEPRPGSETVPAGPVHRPDHPERLSFDEMMACHGQVPLPEAHAAVSRRFPGVSLWLGTDRLGALATSSFLVGMVCPGLHSIYRNLNLTATPELDRDGLRFRVKYSDEDYRLIRLAVAGAGWSGLIDTFARPEPTAQADLARIATHVAANEFAGTAALVVGGSRGLGELVARILAVGGAHVTITYAVGEADARRLRDEIVAFGGRCDIMRYDVRQNAAEQLAQLKTAPAVLYYMATPMIFQRAIGAFSADRLQEFLTFSVTGFDSLCRALRSKNGSAMAIFYPSSVSIDERPANMTEYTMAKAAGEILCADMSMFQKWGPILVKRLPRLPTDQTATLYDDEVEDPLDVMLPIVRELHARIPAHGL